MMNRRQGTCNSDFVLILSNYFPRGNLNISYFTKLKIYRIRGKRPSVKKAVVDKRRTETYYRYCMTNIIRFDWTQCKFNEYIPKRFV